MYCLIPHTYLKRKTPAGSPFAGAILLFRQPPFPFELLSVSVSILANSDNANRNNDDSDDSDDSDNNSGNDGNGDNASDNEHHRKHSRLDFPKTSPYLPETRQHSTFEDHF
ncbi:hypothetical protein [Desmospora profundinema]|uniref:Uncharacterized protein n=1 Tax=Desmospora profundinema TaxID=1571184 RepID=A0ABU1IGW3_9BACL|nr:hypothetical protein [Desmospora profundinema]MDR6224022.1 hypothetical protein [Desmospora profundinema]